MNKLQGSSRSGTWFMAVLTAALVAGCGGGGRDRVLGTGDIAVRAPSVTAVTPLPDATGIRLDDPDITATFSEPMAPITGSASFVLSCAAPCANPTGTVTLDASNRIATYTLMPGSSLAPLTLYTASITGAQSRATGLALESPFVWRFTTAARPSVTMTLPVTTIPGPTEDVPGTTAISAVFSKDMAPATITAAGSFTVTCAAPCASPAGAVSYDAGSRTAAFAAAAALAPGRPTPSPSPPRRPTSPAMHWPATRRPRPRPATTSGPSPPRLRPR